MTKNETEEEFLQSYSFSDYSSVAVTVDLAVFTIRNNALSILLIQRGGHPEMGKWALPGGFVNTDESLDSAAYRELQEETHISLNEGYLEQLKTYGSPTRDKRGYVTSVAYVALVPKMDSPEAADDADDARFFSVEDVLSDEFNLAFDHQTIIKDGLERVRAKIEYSPVAHHFLDDEVFSMSELRSVYEIVWGVNLLPSNFRRKMLSVPGLLDPVEGKKRSPNSKGGPASELYKATALENIYPPLKRS